MIRVLRQAHDGYERGYLRPAPGQPSSRELKSLLKHFLATELGLQWLANVVDDWDERLSALRSPPGGIAELNAYVLSSFKDFVSSETGRRLSARIDSEVSQGTLMVPAYLVEQLVKMRLKHAVLMHGRPLVASTAWRVAVCCGVLHGMKAALRRFTRKWARPHRVVCFVTEIMLPTHVMGAMWGVYTTLGKVHRALAAD
jgi:hypothetical protein